MPDMPEFYDGQTDYIPKLNAMAEAFAAGPFDSVSKTKGTVLVGLNGVPVGGVTGTGATLQNLNDDPRTLQLNFDGIVRVDTPTIITKPIADTLGQIFTADSQVTIANGKPVRPEWFGDWQGIRLANKALPSTGGVIQLLLKRYGPQGFRYGLGADMGEYLGKDNVTILGAKMPEIANDCRTLVGGTIIEGLFLAYANNFEVRDIGVDSGIDVLTAAGGPPSEGFCITYPSETFKAFSTVVGDIRVHNIVGLCSAPLTPVHAVLLAEGVKNLRATGEIIACYGVHGIVNKAQGTYAAKLSAYCNGGEGVIVKSDVQATSYSTQVQLGSILVNARGPFGSAPYVVATTGSSLVFQCAGNNIGTVQIDGCELFGHPRVVETIFEIDGQEIESIQIGQLISDQYYATSPDGLDLRTASRAGGAGAGTIKNFTVGSAILKNGGRGLLVSVVGAPARPGTVNIGQLVADNMTDVAVDVAQTSGLTIGSLTAINCAAGVYRINDNPNISVGALTKIGGGPVYGSGGQAPELLNGWAQPGSGEEQFSVELLGGSLSLVGIVATGTLNTIAQLPQWAWPSKPQRLLVVGYNGVAQTAVALTVTTDGKLVVNQETGGLANCSSYVSFNRAKYRK